MDYFSAKRIVFFAGGAWLSYFGKSILARINEMITHDDSKYHLVGEDVIVGEKELENIRYHDEGGSCVFCDESTGLSFSLIKNKRSIVLSFGGTTSGKNASESYLTRPLRNMSMFVNQVKVNVYNELGVESKIHRQAAKILEKLCHFYRDLGKDSIHVVGHSLGGSLALSSLSKNDYELEHVGSVVVFGTSWPCKSVMDGVSALWENKICCYSS